MPHKMQWQAMFGPRALNLTSALVQSLKFVVTAMMQFIRLKLSYTNSLSEYKVSFCLWWNLAKRFIDTYSQRKYCWILDWKSLIQQFCPLIVLCSQFVRMLAHFTGLQWKLKIKRNTNTLKFLKYLPDCEKSKNTIKIKLFLNTETCFSFNWTGEENQLY